MRILHLLQNFPPEFTGGTERYVLQLAQAQLEMGHSPLVVCGSEEIRSTDGPVSFTCEGVACYRLHRRPDEAYSILPHHPRIGQAINALATAEKIDTAHIHHWFHLDLDLARRLSQGGLPTLLTLHDFYSTCPRFFRRTQTAEDICAPGCTLEKCTSCVVAETGPEAKTELQLRRAEFAAEFKAAGQAIVFSRAMLNFFQQEPELPPIDYHLLPPGIHEPEPWQKAATPKPAGPPWKIGYWGGICRAKGLDLAVRALAGNEFKGKIEFHLWGPVLEADLIREMTKVARAADLPLFFHDQIKAWELPAQLADLTCALFPSRCFESYSMTVDEAALAGLPIVAAHIGALPERLPKGSQTFPPGDEKALTRAIAQIIADPIPPRHQPNQIPAFKEHASKVAKLYLR